MLINLMENYINKIIQCHITLWKKSFLGKYCHYYYVYLFSLFLYLLSFTKTFMLTVIRHSFILYDKNCSIHSFSETRIMLSYIKLLSWYYYNVTACFTFVLVASTLNDETIRASLNHLLIELSQNYGGPERTYYYLCYKILF